MKIERMAGLSEPATLAHRLLPGGSFAFINIECMDISPPSIQQNHNAMEISYAYTWGYGGRQ